MGAITSGGLHVIGRIAPDQLGLNLPDRVFRLIGNKPRLGAGRPSSLIIVGDSLPVFIGAPPYPRPCSRTLSVMPFRRLLAPRPTRAHSADHLDEQWLAWA